MKKVIVVVGPENTGKTASVKRSAAILGVKVSNKIADIVLVSRLKIKNRLKYIGIASGGDNLKIIQQNIDLFEKCGLEYAVFACRGFGAGYRAIESFATRQGAEFVRVETVACNGRASLEAYHKQIAGRVALQVD